MFSVAESVQAVEKNGDKLFTKELPRGRHCTFIKLSDNWGLGD